MKWVTRERARVDRIACPWLISRFIDREPTFLCAPLERRTDAGCGPGGCRDSLRAGIAVECPRAQVPVSPSGSDLADVLLMDCRNAIDGGGLMPRIASFVLCAMVLVVAGAATAEAVLIDFDDLPGMSNSPGAAVPVASQLSSQYLALGAAFESDSAYVAVVDLTSSGPNHAITNPNGIGGVSGSGALSYGTPIEIAFFEAGTGLVGVTDFVQIRGDQIPITGTATLTGYGAGGAELASVTANDVAGGLTLTLNVAGIHRVVLSETSATIAFDNLEFNAPVAAPAVPEPASLLLVGLGAAGLVARARRRSTRPR